MSFVSPLGRKKKRTIYTLWRLNVHMGHQPNVCCAICAREHRKEKKLLYMCVFFSVTEYFKVS